MSFPELKTQRTKLIRITEEYIDDLYLIFSNDKVTEFMDIYPMKSLEETKVEWIDWSREIYESGYGIRWGILFDGHIIGTCGFHNIRKTEGRVITDIGYDLGVKYWGKGFISEVVPVAIDYGFNVMGIQEIHACIYPDNTKSIRSITRLRFKYSGIKALEEKCKDRFTEEEVYICTKSNE